MEGEIFLSATQYPGVLLQSLNEQRGRGLFCDVTVVVEGQQFPAHRNILSASSTYFHQLFSVAGQVVELSFVRAEIFGKILDYIYSSKITSVRSDVLDEVIKSGQELGVKFIGDLGITPAKGKNVPSKVNVSASGTSASNPNQRDAETQETVIKPEATDGMPVMTHSFSLQGVQFESTKITVSDWDGEDDDDDDDDDDDVIFCSEIVPPKECAKDKNAASQTQPCSSPVGASDRKSCGSGGSPHLRNTRAAQNFTLSASQNSNQAQSGAESPVSAPPQHFTGNIIGLNRSLLNSSFGGSSLHQTRVTPAINLLEENHQPSHNGFVTGVEATAVGDEEVVEDDFISSSSLGWVSNSSLVQQPSVSKAASTEGSGVQKKQFTFSQEASPHPGELKIKISDVLSGNNKELGPGVASKDVADGLKIRTFDAATEIGGLSTGCKVYANISEDTYDIIIPVENDSEEGEAEPDDAPKRSGDESLKGKRMKVKHNYHYELVENGRVYYICIVCQKPFLHLSSLWRHFNIHSWEKKFLCRYCDKVFALAECRTRHEVLHTRERRYQCLLCGEFLLRYQNVASHIRSVHGQEPSGDTKLYQLHPCRSLQLRQDTCISDPHPSGVPAGINEGGIICCGGSRKDGTEGTTSNSPAKQITWDDIFVPGGNETICEQNQLEGITEFEFVRPESH